MEKQNRYQSLNEADHKLLSFIYMMICFDSVSISGDFFNFNDDLFFNVWKDRIEIKDINGKKTFYFSKNDIVDFLRNKNVSSDIVEKVERLPDIDGGEFKLLFSDDEEKNFEDVMNLYKEMDETSQNVFNDKFPIISDEIINGIEDESVRKICSIISSWFLFSNDEEILKKTNFSVDALRALPMIYYYCLLKFYGISQYETDHKINQIVADWLSDSSINRISLELSDLGLMPVVFASFLNGTNINIIDRTEKIEEKYVIYIFKTMVEMVNKISPTSNDITFNEDFSEDKNQACIGYGYKISEIIQDIPKFNRTAFFLKHRDFECFNLQPFKHKFIFFAYVDKILKLNGKDGKPEYLFLSYSGKNRKLQYTDYSSSNKDAFIESNNNYRLEQYVFIKNLINRIGFSSYAVDKKDILGTEVLELSEKFLENISHEENDLCNSLFKASYYKKYNSATFWGELEDFATIIRGQVLSTENGSSGVAFEMNPGDIADSGYISNVVKIVVCNDHDKNEKYRIKKGDILVGVKGLVGRVGFVDREIDNLYAGQAIAIVRVKKDCPYPPEFFFSMLKTIFSSRCERDQYLSKNSKTIIMDKFRKMVIPFPDRPMAEYVQRVKELFSIWKLAINMNTSIGNAKNLNDLNVILTEHPDFVKEVRTEIVKNISKSKS